MMYGTGVFNMLYVLSQFAKHVLDTALHVASSRLSKVQGCPEGVLYGVLLFHRILIQRQYSAAVRASCGKQHNAASAGRG